MDYLPEEDYIMDWLKCYNNNINNTIIEKEFEISCLLGLFFFFFPEGKKKKTYAMKIY